MVIEPNLAIYAGSSKVSLFLLSLLFYLSFILSLFVDSLACDYCLCPSKHVDSESPEQDRADIALITEFSQAPPPDAFTTFVVNGSV